MQHIPKAKDGSSAVMGALLSLMGVLVPWALSGRARTSDFASHYVAGELALHEPAQLYSLAAQRSHEAALHTGKFLPWAHPAAEALIFAPLSLLPLQTAFYVWAGINLVLLCWIVYLLRGYLAELSVLNGCAVFAACVIPLGAGLAGGQDHVVTLLLYCVAFLLLELDHDTLAGCALGLALIRFQLAIPVLIFFVAVRRWRVIGGALLSASALALVSVALVGRSLIPSYRAMLAYLGSSHDSFSASHMPSLRGLLAFAMPQSAHVPIIAVAASAAVMLFGVWLWMTADRAQWDVLLSSAILLALAIDYHSFLYEMSTAALPAILLVRRSSRSAWMLWLFAAAEVTLVVTGGQFALLAPLLLIAGIWAAGAARRDANRMGEGVPIDGKMTLKDDENIPFRFG